MMLCLDVGNTQIYGGVFDENGEIFHRFRLTTSATKTSDELGLFLKSVLVENDVDASKINKVGICSVVPQQDYSLKNAILKYFKINPFILQAGVKTGIKLKAPNPKEVGADRIAGAIAGAYLYEGQNLIVVDFGTATTLDVITKDKEYLGGAILSGVKLNAESLVSNTAKLPSVQIGHPEKAVGRTTVECIQSGLYFGTIGSVKEITSRMKQEAFPLPEEVTVVATGGLAGLFANQGLYDVENSDLVLQGLRICYLKNL